MPKTVLITGSSTGIGRAAAWLFQKNGWNVAATMRTPQPTGEWAKQENVLCMRLDVTDLSSIHVALQETIRRFGSIDVVVNNAGYGMVGPFEASTPEGVERQFATNVLGLMNVTREILSHFRERGQGSIINIASVAGRVTFPFYSVYHATKWAVEGFTESLRYELLPFNIKVKIVEPGPVKTDFFHRSLNIVSKHQLTAYDRLLEKAMPTLQQGAEIGVPPERVARVIYRAATDGSWKLRYLTNATYILGVRKALPLRVFQGIVRRAVFR